MTSPVPRGSGPPGDTRLRGGILFAVAVALLVILAVWWWSFAGPGRDRFRSMEPTPAETSAPPS